MNKITYEDMFPSLSALEIQDSHNLNTASESLQADFRQSHKQALQNSWNSLTLAAMSVAERVDPFQADIPAGVVVSAAEALNWSNPSCDVRPRLLDKSTGTFRMIDSGSQITACVKCPEDKIDNSVKLIAVNGSTIPTYGFRKLNVKIGRKNFFRLTFLLVDFFSG